jgi:hypothetical protein
LPRRSPAWRLDPYLAPAPSPAPGVGTLPGA